MSLVAEYFIIVFVFQNFVRHVLICALFRHLFNAAFLSCWTELDEGQQDELVNCIQIALSAPDVPPEVTHTLLNLAEFMEHTDKVGKMLVNV